MPSVNCIRCGAGLPSRFLDATGWTECPSCRTPTVVAAFPALAAAPKVETAAEPVVVDGDACCFYHSHKKAVVPCDGCGRFLCTLCEIQFEGRHLCPRCIEAGSSRGRIASLENSRFCHDSLALMLAVLPLLMCYFTVLTAPAAIYVAIRYWNAPSSIVPRTRARAVLAIAIAGLELAGWAAILAAAVF